MTRHLQPLQIRLLEAIPSGCAVRPPDIEPQVPGVTRRTLYRWFDTLSARGALVRVTDPHHPRAKLYCRADSPAAPEQPLYAALRISKRDLWRVQRILATAAKAQIVVYAKRGTFTCAVVTPQCERRLRILSRYGKATIVGYYKQARGQPQDDLRQMLIDDLRACRLLEFA